jgi:hypothetical protein
MATLSLENELATFITEESSSISSVGSYSMLLVSPRRSRANEREGDLAIITNTVACTIIIFDVMPKPGVDGITATAEFPILRVIPYKTFIRPKIKN